MKYNNKLFNEKVYGEEDVSLSSSVTSPFQNLL
jgi:hypothetical protein